MNKKKLTCSEVPAKLAASDLGVFELVANKSYMKLTKQGNIVCLVYALGRSKVTIKLVHEDYTYLLAALNYALGQAHVLLEALTDRSSNEIHIRISNNKQVVKCKVV